jgi:hypothetical protein
MINVYSCPRQTVEHGAANLRKVIAASDSAGRLVCRRRDGERIPPESDATRDESKNRDDRGHNDGELGCDRAAICVARRVH